MEAEGNTDEAQVQYTLGQTYAGSARRQVKLYGYRGTNRYRKDRGRGFRMPRGMEGVKGCFKCGTYHRAAEHHTREEVTEAIRKISFKHPTAYLPNTEKGYIAEMCYEVDNYGNIMD